MRVLSLFSGIGAFEKAMNRCGIECELVNYCEIDKYASKGYSLIHGVDESMNLGEITKVDTSTLHNIDLVTYGFPCQDISNAGKQRGFADENGERTRSGLFFEALRIIEDTQPKFAICENVKALTSKKFEKEFAIVLESLEAAGYNNYWQVLNAKNYGVPQNRERVFVISIRKDIDKGFAFPVPFPLEKRLKDVLEETVDEKYYLKDTQIFFINNSFAQEKKGNGFRFEPHVKNNADVAKTITTRAGGRMDDNFVIDIESDSKSFRFDSTNLEIVQVAQMYPNSGNPQAGRIYDADGISPSLDTCQDGNRMPKITEPMCAASRGRYTGNGKETEQRLEINKEGTTNTITTVQKDNYIIEPVMEPKIVDDIYNSRPPRIYDEYAPTLRSERTGLKVIEPVTDSTKKRSVRGFTKA